MGNGWNSIDIRCVEHVVTMDFIAKKNWIELFVPCFPSAWNRGDGISMDRCTEHLRMNFPYLIGKKHGKTMGFRWGFSLPPMASPLRSSGRSTPSSMKRPVAQWTFRSHWPLPYWRRWMPMAACRFSGGGINLEELIFQCTNITYIYIYILILYNYIIIYNHIII